MSRERGGAGVVSSERDGDGERESGEMLGRERYKSEVRRLCEKKRGRSE